MSAPSSPRSPEPLSAAPAEDAVEALDSRADRPELRTRGLARLWPRVILLLVLVGGLIAFRAILTPFALAIFLAYMLHPIVRRIEKVRINHKSPPRWLSVVLIYAALATVSWRVVPPIAVRIAGDLGGLKDTVPAMFGTYRTWQEDLNQRIAGLLEVTSLPTAAERQLRIKLRQVQDGTLSSGGLLRTTDAELAAQDAEKLLATADAAPPPGGFSMFALHFHWSGENGQPAPPTAATASAALTTTEPADSDAATDPPPEEVAEAEDEVPTQRFIDSQRDLYFKALRAAVNTALAAPGRATEVPTFAAAQAKLLASEHLELSADDQCLQSYAEVVENQVQQAIRQEEYADVAQETMDNSLTTARVWATAQLRKSTMWVTKLIAGAFDLCLVLMLAAFFLISFSRMRDYVRDLVPPQYQTDYAALLRRIDTRLSGVVRGQVIICIVNGTLTYLGLYAIGLTSAPLLVQYAALLAFVAAVLSLIPIFGVILSTVPMLLFALTQSVWVALAVVAWIAIIHAIEAYLLNPHIMGHSAHMNPILVVFALLAGKHLAGLLGALLAVPIAAVIVAMFGFYRRRVARIYATEAGVEIPEDPWGD